MQDFFQLGLVLISTPFVLFWVYLAAFNGKKYQNYIESDFAREFQMRQLFCVGFSIMRLFHFNSKSKRARMKIKEISEIKGKRYAEYYYYIMQGAKITYAYTIMVFMLLFAVLAGSVEALFLGIVLAVLLVMYVDFSLKDKLNARRQEILMDLPQALSKLTLLINSGMVVREAWKRTAVTGTRQLYVEMQNTSLEIENGVMEAEAYRNFAERCGIKEVRKFAALIIQNLKKGNEELAMFLEDLSEEMWEIKKNEVKQKGEKANSQLLLPVFLIFIGIMIMVLVPMMNGIG